MSVNAAAAWGLIGTVAVAVIALAVSFQLAMFAGFFLLLGWWSWHRLLPAFYLLLVLAPLLPMFKITQTVGTITLLKDVIILVLFVKLFLLPLLGKRLPYRRNILLLPALFLLIWVAIGVLQADSLLLGILRARDIVLYILLYVAVLYLPSKPAGGTPRLRGWYTEALIWFGLSATITAALGWYQFFLLPESAVLRFDPARNIWIPRVSGIMAHPSIFGEYLVLASALLLAVLAWAKRRQAVWLGATFLFLVPLVYLTYSRAVWLGYAAGLGAMFLAYAWTRLRKSATRRVPFKMIAGAGVGFILIGALTLQFTSLGVFVRSAFDPTYGSNAERLEFMARLVAPLTPTQALLGAGLGDVTMQNLRQVDVTAFDVASGAGRVVQLAKNTTLVDNQYLKTFVELGLAGLLIYAWIYWRVLKGSWQLVTQNTRQSGGQASPAARTIGLWGIGFTIAFLVQGFFIDIWDIFPTNLAFWIIAALVSREQV